MIAGVIEIQMLADMAQIKRNMEEAKGIIGNAVDKMGESVERLRGMFIGLAAAYVGTQTVAEFVRTADAMAALEGRLKNVTGAGREFEAAQKDLYRISQSNNVSLEATTTLFTRIYDPIKKMGGGTREATVTVDALSTALRINNASTAESSSAILQFSQAMAGGVLRGEEFNAVNEAAPPFLDALASALGVSRGELRKMAEEGKLTADVVGNAMPRALAELSGKAMGLPDTVGGAFSDLKNDAALLAAQLDKTTGSTAGLADMVNAGAGLVREFTAVLRDNAGSAAIAGQGFDTVGFAIRVVGTIAETVLVLMANVSYSLQAIGREAGGLAAQVVAVVTGNFAEFNRIGDEMKADAVLARAEVDRYSERVLGMTDRVMQSRAALKEHSLSSAENTAEMLKLQRQAGGVEAGYTTLKAATTGLTKEQKDAIAEAKKADEAYLKLKSSITDKTGAMLLEQDQQTKLTDGQKFALGIMQNIQDGTLKITDARKREITALLENYLKLEDLNTAKKAEIELSKIRGKEFDEAFDKMEKDRLQVEKRIGASRTYLEKLQQETGDLKLSKSELALVTAERELERLGVVKGTEAYEAYIDKIRQAVVDKENTAATISEIKKVEDQAKATADNIEKGLIDSLYRAFESGKDFWTTLWDGIKNTLKTTVLKFAVEGAVSWIKDAGGTLLGNLLGTGNSGLGGFFSDLKSGMSTWFGGLGSMLTSLIGGLGGSLSGILSGLGSGISSLFGGGSSIGGAVSGIGSLLGGGASSLITSIGSPIALAGIALAIANKLFGSKGGPKVSGAFNNSGAAGIPGGGVGDSDAASIFNAVQSRYAGYAQAIGGTAGTLTGASFFAKDPNGSANTQLVLDAVLNGQQIYSRNNRTGGGNVEDVGRSDAEFANAVASAQTAAIISALKATTYSDTNIASMVAQLDVGMSAASLDTELRKIAAYKDQIDGASTATSSPVASVSSGLSGEVVGIYTRIALATEGTLGALGNLQTWFYDSAVAGANLTRQAIYDSAANDSVTRNSIVAELQMLRAEVVTLRDAVYTQTAQVVPSLNEGAAQGRRSADALERATQGNPWIVTKAA